MTKKSKEGEELLTYNKNERRIGYNLHINCLLKHVNEDRGNDGGAKTKKKT